MRSALILSGKVGGMSGKDGKGKVIDFEKCFHNYQKNIIQPNNCDVFIHCWEPQFKEQLKYLYSPKECIFEPQIQFKTKLSKPKDKQTEFRHLSRWFSVKTGTELKDGYESFHGFKYDWVMISRFDAVFFTKLDFSKLDNKFLYASNFNQRRKGYSGEHATFENATKWNKTGPNYKRFSDIWFLGSSENIRKLVSLYSKIRNYTLTDPHRAIWDHISNVWGNPMDIVKFILYYWFDYELYRTWSLRCGNK